LLRISRIQWIDLGLEPPKKVKPTEGIEIMELIHLSLILTGLKLTYRQLAVKKYFLPAQPASQRGELERV
jgi:hypothetical protein